MQVQDKFDALTRQFNKHFDNLDPKKEVKPWSLYSIMYSALGHRPQKQKAPHNWSWHCWRMRRTKGFHLVNLFNLNAVNLTFSLLTGKCWYWLKWRWRSWARKVRDVRKWAVREGCQDTVGNGAKRSWMRPFLYLGAYVLIGWLGKN